MAGGELRDQRMGLFLNRLEYVRNQSRGLSGLLEAGRLDEAERLVDGILESWYALKGELPKEFWSDAAASGFPAENMYYSYVISLRNGLGWGHMRREEWDKALEVFNKNLVESERMTGEMKDHTRENIYVSLCNAYLCKGALAEAKMVLTHLKDQAEAKKLQDMIAKLEAKPPKSSPGGYAAV
jgi:hypothetical protein